MHKRRAQTAGTVFYTACLIWALAIYVLLHISAYNPQASIHLGAPTGPAAAAAAAAGAGAAGLAAAVGGHTAAAAAAGHTAAAFPMESLEEGTTTAQAGGSSTVTTPQAKLQLVLSPQTFAGSPMVVVTSTTAPYIEWTLNWSAHLKRLGVNHAVVALDKESVTALGSHGLSVADASLNAAQLGLMTHQSVRRQYDHLRTLGYLRVGLPLKLMRQYGWQSMVLSDADVIWQQHPVQLLQLYPGAELMVSTDCLSVKAVMQQQPEVHRCGMQPGGWNSAWNTGVVVVRNTPQAMAFMDSWQEAMAPGSPSKSAEGWWIDDQLALTQLLDDSSLPFQGLPGPSHTSAGGATEGAANDMPTLRMGPYNASTIMAMKRTLKVVALPPLVIAGGHVAFHQRLHEVYNVTPFALHYTFQAKFDNAGKLSRVRESNMWLLDPPDPSASKYLTYGNTVQAWIGALDSTWQQHTGKKLAELHKHLLAAAYQLQVLTEALAAAHVLNRTLVPPRMVCYCTQDSSAWTDPLHTCSIVGSDKLPPFECTIENLINIVELQRNYAHVMRTPDFLAGSAAPTTARSSRAEVKWSKQQELQMPAPNDIFTAHLLAAMQAQQQTTVQPVLPTYVSETQLRQHLGPFAATAVIDFGLLAPGWFAGLEDLNSALTMQQVVKDLTVYVGWCCLLESEAGQNMDHAYVEYQKPVVPLSAAVPQLTAPAGSTGSAGDAGSTGTTKALSLSATAIYSTTPTGSTGGTTNFSTTGHTGRAKLAGQQFTWQPADDLFKRPSWCTQKYLHPFNWNVSSRPQHPCSYLHGVEYSQVLKQDMLRVLQGVHKLRVKDAQNADG